jgi:hypothetical protein
MKRWFTWLLVGFTILALVAADLMPMLVEAEAAALPAPAPVQAPPAAAAGVHVAQLFSFGNDDEPRRQQPRKKRRSLLDMLFGRDEEPSQPQVTVAPKKAAPRKQAATPPAKPEIPKSPNATRLAVMGDSMAGEIADALERFYAEDPNLVVVPMVKGSSGFVRVDHYDWGKAVDEAIAKDSFDMAVVIIGINDRQTMKANGESFKSLSEGWTALYRARLNAFVAKFRAANKPLIWIGLPPMSSTNFSQAMNQISNYERLAVFAGGGEFLDIYDRFLSDAGKYSSFGPDLKGQRVRVRKDDGIHFAAAGADKIAYYLSQSLRLFYRGGGTVGLDVADPLGGTDAGLMLRPPYQGIGQLRLLEIAGAVIPLTTTPKRAAELVSAGSAPGGEGFDLEALAQAPVGRADAFGVGVTPEASPEGP